MTAQTSCACHAHYFLPLAGNNSGHWIPAFARIAALIDAAPHGAGLFDPALAFALARRSPLPFRSSQLVCA